MSSRPLSRQGAQRLRAKACANEAIWYNGHMTSSMLKEVLERVETWPEERQQDAAHVLIEMEHQDACPIGLTDAQVAEVERRLAKPDKEFVTLEEARERFDLRRA